MLLSEALKQLVMIELTGPWEDCIEEANKRKIPVAGTEHSVEFCTKCINTAQSPPALEYPEGKLGRLLTSRDMQNGKIVCRGKYQYFVLTADRFSPLEWLHQHSTAQPVTSSHRLVPTGETIIWTGGVNNLPCIPP